MHSAPAVRYPVARSRYALATVAVLWLVAAALWGWWSWMGADAWRLAMGFGSLVVGGSVAALLLRAMPLGNLRWDGQAWWWHAGEAQVPVTVALRFDFQHVLLLHVAGLPGRNPWCCVERTGSPRIWHDLRRALYASSRLDRSPAAGTATGP